MITYTTRNRLSSRLSGGLAVCVAALVLMLPGCGDSGSGRAGLERALVKQGKLLVTVPYGLPEGAGVRRVCFDRETLRDTPLYLRNRNPESDDAYLLIRASGETEGRGPAAPEQVTAGELFITAAGMSLRLDGKPVIEDLRDWDVFWVGGSEKAPATRDVLHPAIRVSDGFMRTEVAGNGCGVTSGVWELIRHGGGMPTTEDEERDYNFQRAVNPFSLRGSDGGVLTYGSPEWFNYLGEARFYFGRPDTGNVVDLRNVPSGTDMLVAQGDIAGTTVAFGWVGAENAFALLQREGDAKWTVLDRFSGKRPPLSNWARIGLAVRNGMLAEGYLDGARVVSAELSACIEGPFHLIAGNEPVEADDVRIVSLPEPPADWAPLFVESKNFGNKRHKNNSDPVQFGQWAEGKDAYKILLYRDDRGKLVRGIATRLPLLGDWMYEAVPYDDNAGSMPDGGYEFSLRPQSADVPGQAGDTALMKFSATKADDGWHLESPEGTLPKEALRSLRFRVAGDDGRRLAVAVGKEWRAVGEPLPDGLFLYISRHEETKRLIAFPRPEHHAVRCRNRINELFEEVPSEWAWVEGAFRMAARWACQNQWNFLACGSTGIPYMTAKKTFSGEQLHEFFISMRPVFPNEAGDESFSYDPTEDPNLQVFRANGGWYNRRDLNFSFCSNGKDPMSGYAIVFAGEDNTVTRLLRKGVVIAETNRSEFLFPGSEGIDQIHWKWWRFTVHKRGSRVLVRVDDTVLFDFTDPEPLPGGHVGFWSVRNGFSLTKVVLTAERIDADPGVLYVDTDCESEWIPLVRDSVSLTQAGSAGRIRVTRNIGAGFGGLRYTPAEPVPVAEKPRFELDVEPGNGAVLNVFLQTTAGDFILPVNAPLAEMKSLLTPRFEKGECFRIPVIPEDRVRREFVLSGAAFDKGRLVCDLKQALTARGANPAEVKVISVSVGNTANPDYLLAGTGGANAAGSSFILGIPQFLPGIATN